MLHSIGRTALAQGQRLLRGFLQEGSGPCSPVLTVKDIVDLMRQACVETSDCAYGFGEGVALKPIGR